MRDDRLAAAAVLFTLRNFLDMPSCSQKTSLKLALQTRGFLVNVSFPLWPPGTACILNTCYCFASCPNAFKEKPDWFQPALRHVE